MEKLLDAIDVAHLLNISKRKFEDLIAHGGGPPYMRLGRVRRWRTEDVNTWVAERVKGLIDCGSDTTKTMTAGDDA